MSHVSHAARARAPQSGSSGRPVPSSPSTPAPRDPAHEPAARPTELAQRFDQLGLQGALLANVRASGYEQPTPIQAQSIPHLIEGRDLLGCARTGTGKTAAFGLPLLQRLAQSRSPSASQPAPHAPKHAGHGRAPARAQARPVRALVLTPTRELAAQVAESLEVYGKGLPLSVAVIYGGVGQAPQVRALQRGVDVLVATPGRLVDLIQQGHARLGELEILVLDEADHMLDLGFLPDVRRILAKLPQRRQTLLFSATMPPPIAQLADGILDRPVKVYASPVASTVELVEQRVHFVSRNDKPALLAHLLQDPAVERALVFTRTKRGADRVAKRLSQSGIRSEAIHGNKSQGARERTLGGFRDGRVRVLIATDIAARGIDVDGVTHVFNFELPDVPESYVHRIGRTGRAGATGLAIALCSDEERELLRQIEKLTRRELARVDAPHFEKRNEPALERAPGEAARRGGGGRANGGKPAQRNPQQRGGGAPHKAAQRGDRRGGQRGAQQSARGGAQRMPTASPRFPFPGRPAAPAASAVRVPAGPGFGSGV